MCVCWCLKNPNSIYVTCARRRQRHVMSCINRSTRYICCWLSRKKSARSCASVSAGPQAHEGSTRKRTRLPREPKSERKKDISSPVEKTRLIARLSVFSPRFFHCVLRGGTVFDVFFSVESSQFSFERDSCEIDCDLYLRRAIFFQRFFYHSRREERN